MTNEQDLMKELQDAKLAQMRGLVIRANINPRSLSQSDLSLANQYASELGMDMSQAKAKDVATNKEKWTARIGGGLDALAFGIVPDKWYSSYRTKDEMNQGKMVGNVLGLAIPGIGAIKAIKGASYLSKLARFANATNKLDKATDAVRIATETGKGISKAEKMLKNAQALVKAKENTKLVMKPSEIVALANQILRGTKTAMAGLETNNIGLGNNPQMNPYDIQQTGLGGMPQM